MLGLEARGLLGPLDTRLVTTSALAILLIIILCSLVLSSLGCLFLVSLLLITVYLSSNLAQRLVILSFQYTLGI